MKSPFAMMALAGTFVAPIALCRFPNGPFAAKCRDEGGWQLRHRCRVPAGSSIRPMNTMPTLTPSGVRAGIDSAVASAQKDPRVFEASTALPSPTLPIRCRHRRSRCPTTQSNRSC